MSTAARGARHDAHRDGARALLLRVGNDPGSLGTALNRVEAFLRARAVDGDDAGQVMLIVDEIASNLVQHAWPDGGRHRFALALGAQPEGNGRLRVTIAVRDDGVPFAPDDAPEPDTDTPLEDRETGGLGWLLIRSMSDRMVYRRARGRNSLVVTKAVRAGTDGGPSRS